MNIVVQILGTVSDREKKLPFCDIHHHHDMRKANRFAIMNNDAYGKF